MIHRTKGPAACPYCRGGDIHTASCVTQSGGREALAVALMETLTAEQVANLHATLAGEWVMYEPGVIDDPTINPLAPDGMGELIAALAEAEQMHYAAHLTG